jgi:hypothetical protein
MSSEKTIRATIINLSAIGSNKSIPEVVAGFASLCDTYSSWFSSCCPSFFLPRLANKIWVMYQHKQIQSLITRIKLGQIGTEEFLNDLLDKVFSFLKKATFSNNVVDNLWEKQSESLFLRKFRNRKSFDQSSRNVALALLEEKWNSIVHFDLTIDGLKAKKALVERNEGEETYLMSNSNPPNIQKTLCWLRKMCPNIKWKKEVDVELLPPDVKDRKIEIAPNIYFCLSYNYKCFKVDNENMEADISTPNLLKQVSAELLARPEEKTDDEKNSKKAVIQVISQYPGDLGVATELKLKAIPAKQFFGDSLQQLEKFKCSLL